MTTSRGEEEMRRKKTRMGEGRQYVVTFLHNVSSLGVHSLD